MGRSSLIGLKMSGSMRRLLFLMMSGITVAMLFVLVLKSHRVVMLSPQPPSIGSHYEPSTRTYDVDINCKTNQNSSARASLRYEVFVVLDGSGNTNRTLHDKTIDVDLMKQLLNAFECRLVSHYYIRVLSYDGVSRPQNETLSLLNNSLQLCKKEGASVVLDFTEISDRSQDALAVNRLMTDSYVQRNIDYFSLVFLYDFTEKPRIQTSLRNFLCALNQAKPKDVGIVFQDGVTGYPDRAFFSRNHFEIFGFFVPQTMTKLNQMFALLRLLYPENLLFTISPQGVATGTTSLPANTILPMVPDLPEYNDTLRRYLSASALNPCLRCRNTTSRMVIAMSLYGSDPRYTMGAIRNAQLLPVAFPGWRLWFYVEKPNENGATKYGPVPVDVLAKLKNLGAEIVLTDAVALGLAPMLWRFTIMDSEEVDVFAVRDCDSRLTPRDAAVVRDWLKKNRTFHCIRDHPSHSNYAVSGGLWGARNKPLRELVGSLRTVMQKYGDGYVQDMEFLGQDVWPKVKDVAYCHDSYSCDRYPSSHPFPVVRIGWEHLGEVYNEYSIGREVDIDILRNAAVNKACVPS